MRTRKLIFFVLDPAGRAHRSIHKRVSRDQRRAGGAGPPRLCGVGPLAGVSVASGLRHKLQEADDIAWAAGDRTHDDPAAAVVRMQDNYDDDYDDEEDGNLVAQAQDPTAQAVERADPTAVLSGSAAPEPQLQPEPGGGETLPMIGEGILKFSALFSAVPTAALSADGAGAAESRKRSRANEQQSGAARALAAPPPRESAEARLFAPSQREAGGSVGGAAQAAPAARFDAYVAAEARLTSRRRTMAPDSEDDDEEEEGDGDDESEAEAGAQDAAMEDTTAGGNVEGARARESQAAAAAAGAGAASVADSHSQFSISRMPTDESYLSGGAPAAPSPLIGGVAALRRLEKHAFLPAAAPPPPAAMPPPAPPAAAPAAPAAKPKRGAKKAEAAAVAPAAAAAAEPSRAASPPAAPQPPPPSGFMASSSSNGRMRSYGATTPTPTVATRRRPPARRRGRRAAVPRTARRRRKTAAGGQWGAAASRVRVLRGLGAAVEGAARTAAEAAARTAAAEAEAAAAAAVAVAAVAVAVAVAPAGGWLASWGLESSITRSSLGLRGTRRRLHLGQTRAGARARARPRGSGASSGTTRRPRGGWGKRPRS